MTLNEIDNPLSDTTVEDELIQKKSLNVEKTPVVKRESVVKSSDMTEIMQQEAVEVANEAMNKFRLEKDMATYIKEEFDKRHSPSWHCVVGRNFGSYVTHETNHFIYFYVQHIAIMLFKTGF